VSPEHDSCGKQRLLATTSIQAGRFPAANSIVSVRIDPSRQGPAPDTSVASASPTLMLLWPSVLIEQGDDALTSGVDIRVDIVVDVHNRGSRGGSERNGNSLRVESGRPI
jgi:hypothetical protein